jgi:hypothetical protein
MRWLARRPSGNTGSPKAERADVSRLDSGDTQPDTGELLAAAEAFIALFHDETPRAGAFDDRMRQVSAEIQANGTYRHTPGHRCAASGQHGGGPAAGQADWPVLVSPGAEAGAKVAATSR